MGGNFIGQYFMPILGDSYGLNCKVFDRSVDRDYVLTKFMEHSWCWNNPFCNSFAERLYKTKKRACWGCDFHKGNIGFEFVGLWALNLLSISDTPPKSYKKFYLVFKELR